MSFEDPISFSTIQEVQDFIKSIGNQETKSNQTQTNATFLKSLQSNPTISPDLITLALKPFIDSNHEDLILGLQFITLLFNLDPQLGLQIIHQSNLFNRLRLLNPSIDPKLCISLSNFLAQAINQKPIRSLLLNQHQELLHFLSNVALSQYSTISLSARHAASLALLKLHLASSSEDLGSQINQLPKLGQLVRLLLNALLSHPQLDPSNLIEALALVSHKAFVRQLIIQRIQSVLSSLGGFLIKPDQETNARLDTSIAYGVATILKNLTAYKELKSEEDQAADRLRRLATQNQSSRSKIEELDEDEEVMISDDQVFEWTMKMLNESNQLMDIVTQLVKTESKQVRRTTAQILFNLVERQACRGKVLQAGGGRLLLKLIATLTLAIPASPSPLSMSSDTGVAQLDPQDLPTLQALAKLLITTNPLLIFGPSPDSPLLLSSIKPLTTLFTHPQASLLQIFEGLMSLTNVASLSLGLAEEVANRPGVVTRIEECMIGIRTGEHELIRRASTQLLCNLANTTALLKSFETGERSPSNRLHLLIALSSSDDLDTALGASGALATLVDGSEKVGRSLASEEQLTTALGRVSLEIIQEGRIGLQYRMMSVLECVWKYWETEDERPNGLREALQALESRLETGEEQDQDQEEVKKLVRELLDRIENHTSGA